MWLRLARCGRTIYWKRPYKTSSTTGDRTTVRSSSQRMVRRLENMAIRICGSPTRQRSFLSTRRPVCSCPVLSKVKAIFYGSELGVVLFGCPVSKGASIHGPKAIAAIIRITGGKLRLLNRHLTEREFSKLMRCEKSTKTRGYCAGESGHRASVRRLNTSRRLALGYGTFGGRPVRQPTVRVKGSAHLLRTHLSATLTSSPAHADGGQI